MANSAYIVAVLVMGLLPAPVPNADFEAGLWAKLLTSNAASGVYKLDCNHAEHGACSAYVEQAGGISDLFYVEEGNAFVSLWTTDPKPTFGVRLTLSDGVTTDEVALENVQVVDHHGDFNRWTADGSIRGDAIGGQVWFYGSGYYDNYILVQDGKGGNPMQLSTPETVVPNGDFSQGAWPEMDGAVLDTSDPHSAPQCARIDGLGSINSEHFALAPGQHTIGFWMRGQVPSGLLIYLDSYDADGNEILQLGGNPTPQYQSGDAWQAVTSEVISVPANAASVSVEIIAAGIKPNNGPLWLDDFTVN